MTAAAIGARIREERRRLGLSQTAFARLGAMTKGAAAKWEAGSAQPNAAVLATWHDAGADILYIVTGRRDPLFGIKTPPAVPPSIADALAAIAAQVAPARARLVIETADEAVL